MTVHAQTPTYADYGAQFSPVYDLLFPREAITELETAWIRNHMPTEIRHVIEFGVGNGRVGLPLAASFMASELHPVEYTGVDISLEMLSQLETRDTDRLVRAVHSDITSFTPTRHADAVLCVCATIAMITNPDDQQAVFHRAAAALRDGGTLIVETHNPEVVHLLHPNGRRSWATALGDKQMLTTFSELTDGVAWHLDYCLIDHGTSTFLTEDSRVTTLVDLDHYADAAGLTRIGHHSGLRGEPIVPHSPTVTAVYVKTTDIRDSSCGPRERSAVSCN